VRITRKRGYIFLNKKEKGKRKEIKAKTVCGSKNFHSSVREKFNF
jgi:hypothetical protein